MVTVFYSTLDRHIGHTCVARWLAELPHNKRCSLVKLRRAEDRLRSLAGYQLLKLACQHIGAAGCRLDALRFAPGRKPHARGSVQFSLSHSYQLVACAVSQVSTVGLDTEFVRPIDGARLVNTLNENERRVVTSDPRAFFHLWTRKEAIIKADGTAGLQHMRDIDARESAMNGVIGFRGRQWHLAELPLDGEYVTHLSTLQPAAPIVQHYVPLSQLC